MSQSGPRRPKPTLDKDLDKISFLEAASRQTSRTLAAPGAALLFILLTAIFAGSYVVGHSSGGVVIAAAAIAAYMALNIGANDVTNNIGAAVGARAMTMTFGLCLAAVFEVAGAVIAGGGVADTIANGILRSASLRDPDMLIWAMLAALMASALLVNIATWLGAPISTTHSIVGSVMGAAIATAGFSAVNWPLVGRITLTWIASPLLSGLIAAGLLFLVKETIIYRDDKIAAARKWVPILIGVMSGGFVGFLALVGLGQLVHVPRLAATALAVVSGLVAWRLLIPVIARQAVGLENRNQSLRRLFRLPLIISAALMSFAHGANDVSNAIGPLAAIVSAAQHHGVSRTPIASWELIIGGLGIAVGLLLYGPKLVRLVGAEITKLNPMRAYCVSSSTALTVMLASWVGLPVSSTHIAVGAVFGVGFFREWYTRNSSRRYAYMRVRADRAKDARGDGGRKPRMPEEQKDEARDDHEITHRRLVRRSHFLSIIAAWMITLPAAACLAGLLATLIFALIT